MEEHKTLMVTSALPYANGDIHLGHLVEYLQTDFWVRFQKMQGHECRYFCAVDTHGTPVMIAAREQGITPEVLIERQRERHLRDFTEFGVGFDHYGTTHSEANRSLAEAFFAAMKEKGHLEVRQISQSWCEHDAMFLPDRFVRGTCPRCQASDQYGDSCDRCGATYAPEDLLDPRCSLCGTPPVRRESEHLFFRLNDFRDFLRTWVPEHTPPEIARKMGEWLDNELRSWDISRDAPYFGFPIPGHEGKFFYVWLDAPIGYLASCRTWCEREGLDFDAWIRQKGLEMVHFIGKDITYFHTLFWPAMLKTAAYPLPAQVFVHGFLTVNGEKMSKSRGTFIKARTYLNHLPAAYLRYYYACKLNGGIGDIDLNLDDFALRINSDLVGKITNLASRGAQLLARNLENRLGVCTPQGRDLLREAAGVGAEVARAYQGRDFSRAMVLIRDFADSCNRYFDGARPWALVKEDPEQARSVLTDVLNLFRQMAIWLQPILPGYALEAAALLGEGVWVWKDAEGVLENRGLQPYVHLMQRVDPARVTAMLEEAKPKEVHVETPQETADVAESGSAVEEIAYEPLCPEITIDDFARLDLRVGRVLEAEEVPEARKLLRLKVDLGFETRQIFAGIKSAYRAEELVNRLVVVVANLKPRQMKFGLSEGMVMAAGPGGKDIFVLSPDSGATPGQRVS